MIEDRESDKISSNNGSDEDIVGSFHKALSSNKPFDRIFALGKVSKILKAYEKNELNHMDKKLLKGFYSRRLNEYSYLARKSKSTKLEVRKFDEDDDSETVRVMANQKEQES